MHKTADFYALIYSADLKDIYKKKDPYVTNYALLIKAGAWRKSFSERER